MDTTYHEDEEITEETPEEDDSEDEAVDLLAIQLRYHATIAELNEQITEAFVGVDKDDESYVHSRIESISLTQQFIQ